MLGVFFWGVFAFGVAFLVPRFVPLFDQLKVDLPAPTQLVLALGRMGEVSAVVALGAAGFAAWWSMTRRVRRLAVYLAVSGVLAVIFSTGAIYLPLEKIDHALKKK
jgi:type II secretory pathway component PulF